MGGGAREKLSQITKGDILAEYRIYLSLRELSPKKETKDIARNKFVECAIITTRDAMPNVGCATHGNIPAMHRRILIQ